MASSAAPVSPADAQGDRSRTDLINRVVRALDFARAATEPVLNDPRVSTMGLPQEKFVAETALLLYCVAPIAPLDPRIARAIDDLAQAILPHARSDENRGAICLDPGHALDHAFAHILLGSIGYRDAAMDALLAESLTFEAAPERLPHRLLEQSWLRNICQRTAGVRPDRSLSIDGSMLARPVDALRATRFDHYGFTHAAMYASDFGAEPVAPDPAVTADANAIAALAFALATVDHDLAAEVLMTWPLLRLSWPPAASIAFEWLARTEDQRGFLTGRGFDPSCHDALFGDDRRHYAIVSCYHTIYVMAFLCASMLRFDCPPPGRTVDDPGAWDGIAGIASMARLVALSDRKEIEAIGPLLLTMALRDATEKFDLPGLRAALQFALDHDLTTVLAARQAAALMRRAALLDVHRPTMLVPR